MNDVKGVEVGKKAKILVVDDDDALLFAFNKIFKHIGYDITTADSVEKAKMLVTADFYVLVITDLRFAESEAEGGFNLIRFVKKKSPATKIILLTAFATQESADEEEKSNPDYRLKKPIKSETIKGLMREMGII